MHIRLYGSCGTDLGRSIAEVTDNIHANIDRFTSAQPSNLAQQPWNIETEVQQLSNAERS